MSPARKQSLDANGFHILLSLAPGPSHGYAIRQEVEERTAGAVRLWPATLYGTLSQLSDDGLITERGAPRGESDDPRRRYYELTAAGRRALSQEAARLDALARLARARLSGAARPEPAT